MPILETIANYLGIKAIDKLTDRSLDFALSKFMQPEYEKYKKCFNPPFVMAFNNTIKIFSDGHSPWKLTASIIQELTNFNDIEINVILGNEDLSVDYFKDNDPFEYSKEALKNYLKIKYDYEPENGFFDMWKDIFSKKYKEAFEEFCSSDNIFFQQTAINLLQLSVEDLKQIKTIMRSFDKKFKEIEINTEEIKEYSKNIDSNVSSIKETINENFDFIKEKISTEYDKSSDFQGELKKLKKLIDENKYPDCISYIEVNIDDWADCGQDFKAKVFNYKGICYLNLNDFSEASIAFNTAISLKPDFDKAISNICLLFLQNQEYARIKEYLKKFPDHNSPFYQQIKFFDYLFVDNDVVQAEEFLEQHKSTIKDYNHLKSKVLFQKKAPYDEIIQSLEQYLSENNDFIASYELALIKYSKLFKNERIAFYFGITQKNKIKIQPVYNEKLNMDELNSFLDYLNNLLSFPKASVENLKALNSSIKIMISTLYSQMANISPTLSYIDELNSNLEIIKNEFDIDNLFMLNFLVEKFTEAKNIYENKLQDGVDREIYIITIFALEEYEEVLSNLEKLNAKEDFSLELLKIISLEQTQKWTEVLGYIKPKMELYTPEIKFFIANMAFSHFEYNFCQEIYLDLTKDILSEKVVFEPEQIYMLANKLNYFKEKELEEKLIFFCWNNHQAEKSFEIGVLCAVFLFNNKKYPECLTVLKKLSEINPLDKKVQELYANIDLINFSPNNLIKNYEEGNAKDYLLPHIANAYIQVKEYDKAEAITENLKHIEGQEINHYLIKAHIYFLKENYDKGISVLTEANNKFPECTEIHQKIVGFVLHRKSKKKLDENFAKIFNESIKFLVDKKIMYSFQVDKDNVFEDVKKGIETIEPLTHLIERENLFIEFLEKYNNFEYPLEIMFGLINQNPIEFFTEILLDKNYSINISLGNEDIMSKEVSYLKSNKEIIINVYTLMLLKILEIDELIQENFNLKISNYTKKTIGELLDSNIIDSPGTLVRQKDGTPLLITGEKPIKKYIDYLKNILKIYEIKDFNSSSNKALELITAQDNIGFEGILYDGIVAVQNDHLLCIDGILSKIYNEYHVQTVSTLSLLEYLYNEQIIDQEKYSGLKVKLCNLNCKYISISANDLYMALNNSYEDFNVLLKTLNNRIFTIDSVAVVFSDFILKLNNNSNISDIKKELALKNIFEKSMILYPSGILIKRVLKNIYNIYSLLENNLQTCLGHCIYDSLYSNNYKEILAFYFASIKKIYEEESIFLINILSDIVTKTISNAPQEIRKELLKYASENYGYKNQILF